MSELVSFECKTCKNSLPISEKKQRYKNRCIQCHKNKKREYRENHKEDITLRNEIYNFNNKDKIKGLKKLNIIKNRNIKYGYTEEKINEIDEKWENMLVIMNEFCKSINQPLRTYNKNMTPRLKEIGIQSFFQYKERAEKGEAFLV